MSHISARIYKHGKPKARRVAYESSMAYGAKYTYSRVVGFRLEGNLVIVRFAL